MRKFNYLLNRTRQFFIFFMLVIVMGASSFADEFHSGFFSNIAVGGYDVTSYFIKKTPIKGSEEFSLYYRGVKWYFENEESFYKFRRNPAQFLPAFGAHDAFLLANGIKKSGNPLYFYIYKNRLYLFSEPDNIDKWQKEGIGDNIAKATKNWIKLNGAIIENY